MAGALAPWYITTTPSFDLLSFNTVFQHQLPETLPEYGPGVVRSPRSKLYMAKFHGSVPLRLLGIPHRLRHDIASASAVPKRTITTPCLRATPKLSKSMAQELHGSPARFSHKRLLERTHGRRTTPQNVYSIESLCAKVHDGDTMRSKVKVGLVTAFSGSAVWI